MCNTDINNPFSLYIDVECLNPYISNVLSSVYDILVGYTNPDPHLYMIYNDILVR